jgi:hypothetical protein
MKVSLYTLKINHQLIEGALISDEQGYAVLQPWSSLGDPSLNFLLKDLSYQKKTSLVQRALELLRIDGDARSKGESLLPAKSLPSHLYLDLRSDSFFKKFETALEEGIELFKFKIGINVERELLALKKIQLDFLNSKFKIRLDANQRFLSFKEASVFLQNFEKSLLERIDFLEDPFRGSPDEWNNLKESFHLHLAHDFADESFRDLCDVWILKPTRNNPQTLMDLAIQKNKKVVFTTALDHEFGQLVSLSVADEFQKKYPSIVQEGGFLSFSEVEGLGAYLSRKKNLLDFEDLRGPGFGCEKLFLNRKWTDLGDLL